MSKTKTRPKQNNELDSVYLFKLVLYLIIGTQWLRIVQTDGTVIPVPVGLFVGIAFAMHDHFQLDRKIEYAVLLLAMFIGFYSQIGIFLNV